MKILKTDIIQFKVYYRNAIGEMVTLKTYDFSYAYSTLVNLNTVAFLDFNASSDGSSLSSSIFKKTKDGAIECLKPYYIEQLKQIGVINE